MQSYKRRKRVYSGHWVGTDSRVGFYSHPQKCSANNSRCSTVVWDERMLTRNELVGKCSFLPTCLGFGLLRYWGSLDWDWLSPHSVSFSLVLRFSSNYKKTVLISHSIRNLKAKLVAFFEAFDTSMKFSNLGICYTLSPEKKVYGD